MIRSGAIRRFGSYFVDNLLTSIISVFFIGFIMMEMALIMDLSYQVEMGIISMQEFWSEYIRLLGSMMVKVGIPQVILGIIYTVVIPYYWDGKTVGRHIVGVQLRMQDGSKLTFWKIFIREVVFKMMWWIVTLGIGSIVDFIMVAVRKDKQTIRDIVTQTEVVEFEGESVKEEYQNF